MKYTTPNEFIQAYLEVRLKQHELHGVKQEDGVKAGVVYQSTQDRWWDFVDKCRVELNDFLEGKYRASIGLELVARLATLPDTTYEPHEFMDFFEGESGVSSLMWWVRFLCNEHSINAEILIENYGLQVVISNPDANLKRKRIVRHAWYERMGIYIELREYEDIATALILALIAAYDHGLWGAK